MQVKGPPSIHKNIKYVLSYGAGVNSTALLIFLLKNKFPLDYVVFADTGSEIPATYTNLNYIKRYLKKKKILLQIVKVRNGESLYDKCERRKVIPSQVWRWCTRDFKILPIYKFYRSLKSPVYQYVGIDYDELYRIKDSKADYVTNVYPLVENKIGRNECLEIIKRANLPIPVKSGCYFCPFNSLDRWKYLYKKYPHLYDLATKLEENGKHMPKQKLTLLPLRILKKKIKCNKLLPVIKVESPCGSECMT